VLAGKGCDEPMASEVRFGGKNLFEMAPDECAAAGLFLAFQYPIECPASPT
jgi:Fe-S cluster assembly ATP-binding protein